MEWLENSMMHLCCYASIALSIPVALPGSFYLISLLFAVRPAAGVAIQLVRLVDLKMNEEALIW